MKLIDWTPVFTGKVSGGKTVFDAGMHFTGTLQCPVCDAHTEIETTGYFGYGNALRKIVSWIIESFAAVRTCESCGVVSGMPKTDLERLRTEAEKIVTDDWYAESRREYASHAV